MGLATSGTRGGSGEGRVPVGRGGEKSRKPGETTGGGTLSRYGKKVLVKAYVESAMERKYGVLRTKLVWRELDHGSH